MAFERHATSKIVSAQDLNAIKTLGFRGEALASIASVAHVTCTTRTKYDTTGIKVVNKGGKLESIEEAACPEGTTFVVRDLFFNTPVRLKFLKKPTTEAGYVSDLMMRLILSRPDVSFRYVSQGKVLYHSAGDGKLASAVFSIYGKESRSMREVKGHQGGVLLHGYVGVGDNARATRAHQSFFINGRYMKSAVLSSGVEAACREHLMQGRYPSCVLHLTMPFEMVDVNVHPNKLECRFQDENALYAAIEAIVRDAFVEKSPLEQPAVMQIVPQKPVQTAPVTVVKAAAVENAKAQVPTPAKAETAATAPKDNPQQQVQSFVKPAEPDKPVQPEKKEPEKLVPRPVPAMKPLKPLQPQRPAAQSKLHEPPAAVQAFMQSYQKIPPAYDVAKAAAAGNPPKVDTPSFLPESAKPMKLIGTAFNSYILVEYDNNLLLIDQQGVHERLQFDRMMKAFGTQNCSQELLIPLIVPATRREQQLLETHQEMLQNIGLTVESFGETEVSIRSIPMILGQPQAGDFLREILDQLEGERGVISMEKRRAAIVALASKKAVRSGERLNEADIRELVVRMVEQRITPTSPRGTPLIVALSHADIDRRFRRPQ